MTRRALTLAAPFLLAPLLLPVVVVALASGPATPTTTAGCTQPATAPAPAMPSSAGGTDIVPSISSTNRGAGPAAATRSGPGPGSGPAKITRSTSPVGAADTTSPTAASAATTVPGVSALEAPTVTGGGGCGGMCPPTGSPAESGLTPDALLVLRCVDWFFGPHVYGGVGSRPNASDHPAGRAVDVMIADYATSVGIAEGDRIAAWVRAHAGELGVTYVIWRARIWNTGEADWAPYTHPTGATDDTSLHLDHVHVSVAGTAGTGLIPTGGPTGSGPVVFPLPAGTAYVDQENFGSTGSHWASTHTGTDLTTACGTPVLAVTAGTVAINTTQAWAGPQLVQISTGPGQLTTWYAHMSTVTVTAGQPVVAGQQIGEVGAEGNATGCHLHLEVHLTGGPLYGPDTVNPTTWLAQHVGTTTPLPSGGGGVGSGQGGDIPPAPPDPASLSILTYNTHIGADHGRSLAAVAADIAATGADVVTLNEVDIRDGTPQAQWLADRLHMHVAYGPNATLGTVRRGNAILSAYPLRNATNTSLPWIPGTERRGLLSADVDLGATSIRVAATHLNQSGDIRLTQAEAVRDLLGRPICTTLVAGDMNSTDTSPMHTALTTYLADTFQGRADGDTVPAAAPRSRIDYILHSPHAFLERADVMPRWTSDHRAVLARFSISPTYTC